MRLGRMRKWGTADSFILETGAMHVDLCDFEKHGAVLLNDGER